MKRKRDRIEIPCLYTEAPECCPYRYRSPDACELGTRHHLFWRRKDYRTELERAFRELPQNSVYCCRGIHDQLELVNRTPDKPSKERMQEAVDRTRQN